MDPVIAVLSSVATAVLIITGVAVTVANLTVRKDKD